MLGAGRKEVLPESGQPGVGGQSDCRPPRTLCTDCRELMPPVPQLLLFPAVLARRALVECSKLFDGLDPGVWPRLGG